MFRRRRRRSDEDDAYAAGLLEALVTGRGAGRIRSVTPPTAWPDDAATAGLLDELLAIGKGEGFLHDDGKDQRAREIGAELNRMGGMPKMRQVHASVASALGRLPARELEAAWDGVGEWLG